MSANVWKYNEAGILQWSAWTGDTARHMVVDVDGNVYVAGHRSGDSVWKFDVDGNEVAAYDTGAATRGVSIDRDGNIWVTGAQVGGKSIWKFDPDLNLLLSIGIAGNAYCVDHYRNYAVVGSQSSGVPKKNLRQYDLNGNLQWELQLNTLTYPPVHAVKAVNYIWAGLDSGAGPISKVSRQGAYISSAAYTNGVHGLDVLPHVGYTYDDIGTLKHQSLIDAADGNMVKHHHRPMLILIGGPVALPAFYGVYHLNKTLASEGVCRPFGSTFTVSTITISPDRTFYVAAIMNSWSSGHTCWKLDFCHNCAAPCTEDWKKQHGDAWIIYGSDVDVYGNCYFCGVEDTT